jgi:hypothetical protein
VLKSIWLEGKRNWHVDHLIHTLVMEYLPNIKIRHKRQERGMEGPDLAKKCRQQILTHTPKTPLDQIQKINDSHFEVQSSNSNKHYQIDLVTTACNCSDFPCIHLCKHIAVVVHFLGGLISDPSHLSMPVCLVHQSSRTVTGPIWMTALLLFR